MEALEAWARQLSNKRMDTLATRRFFNMTVKSCGPIEKQIAFHPCHFDIVVIKPNFSVIVATERPGLCSRADELRQNLSEQLALLQTRIVKSYLAFFVPRSGHEATALSGGHLTVQTTLICVLHVTQRVSS